MSIKINKNDKSYPVGVIPKNYPSTNIGYDNSQSGLSATKVQGAIDEITGLKTIIKSKTMLASTGDANNVCATGLYTSNAIPIAVNCEGMTAYIGSTYIGEWLVGFYDYGTGTMIPVTNKQITIYYIDLTKISVQS